MWKRVLFVCILVLVLLSGCAKYTVRGYLKAVMNNAPTKQYVVAGFKDEVVDPYVVVDYRILNSGPYDVQQVRLGTFVRTEITFRSEAGTPLPKVVQFTLTNDNKIRDVK